MALTTTPFASVQRAAAAAALRLAANVALVIGGGRLVGVQAVDRSDHTMGVSTVVSTRRTVRVLLADLQALANPVAEGTTCTIEGDATPWCLAEPPLQHLDTGCATLRLERAS